MLQFGKRVSGFREDRGEALRRHHGFLKPFMEEDLLKALTEIEEQ